MANFDINRNFINIGHTQATTKVQNHKTVHNTTQGQNVDFKTLLEKNLQTKQQVTFSKHAQQRIDDRNIDVSEHALAKLSNAVSQAQSKGVKDALILNGDTMFIVNTTNRIVVTALKGSQMKDNVFTNIDGTVII